MNVVDLVKMGHPLCFLLEFVELTFLALQGKSTVSVDSASEIFANVSFPVHHFVLKLPESRNLVCLSFLHVPPVLSTREGGSQQMPGRHLFNGRVNPRAFAFLQDPLSFTRAL